jgi:hypothetical protein
MAATMLIVSAGIALMFKIASTDSDGHFWPFCQVSVASFVPQWALTRNLAEIMRGHSADPVKH